MLVYYYQYTNYYYSKSLISFKTKKNIYNIHARFLKIQTQETIYYILLLTQLIFMFTITL